MRKAGLTEDQIDSERYYNATLYKGCVDRFMFFVKAFILACEICACNI